MTQTTGATSAGGNASNAARPSPLAVGDLLPHFELPATTIDKWSAANFAGKAMGIIFFTPATSTDQIDALAKLQDDFEKSGILLVGSGGGSLDAQKQFAAERGLKFAVIADGQAQLARMMEAGEGRVAFLLDPNSRVYRIYPRLDAGAMLGDAKAMLTVEPPRQVLQQAPVLLVPRVLPVEFRRQLIDFWESENKDSGFMKEVDGKTVGMYDYSHKIRRDHFVKPGAVLASLKDLVGRRVLPEIFKSFNYEVTRVEDFRIACYDAGRGGYFRPHRDNTTSATAHRRFAVSLLLNDDYEGGFLRFPEYGPHLYRPAAGDAVVFSCTLLHEATDVTAGRRFVLLSFFYGEREAKLRDEYARKTSQAPKA